MSAFREYDNSRRLFHKKVKELESDTLKQARMAMGTSKEDDYLRYLTDIFTKAARVLGEVKVQPFSVWKGKDK